MFWTVIFGTIVTLTFILLNCFITTSMTFFTWAVDFVPVHTSFPELNTRTADLGSLTLRTAPGNVLGLYSMFGSVFASFTKGIGFSKEVVATIFCI